MKEVTEELHYIINIETSVVVAEDKNLGCSLALNRNGPMHLIGYKSFSGLYIL
jgi:hypothetical protein